MKNTLLGIVLIVFFCMQSFAQDLKGLYSHRNEYLLFKDNGEVEFRLNARWGTTTIYTGVGTYKIQDGFLKIRMTEYIKPLSYIEYLYNYDDVQTMNVWVVDIEPDVRLVNNESVVLSNNNLMRQVEVFDNEYDDNKVTMVGRELYLETQLSVMHQSYPTVSRILPTFYWNDCVIHMSPYMDAESTQAFLIDKGDGLGIKMANNALSIGRMKPSNKDFASNEKSYIWDKFVKEY